MDGMFGRCGPWYLLVEKSGSSLAPRANQIESTCAPAQVDISITSHH